MKIFDSKKMLLLIEDFHNLYETRPISDNRGGMKSPHMFALFFYLNYKKPKLIIESGVWRGQGTWLIDQICPNSKVVCLDLNLKNLIFKNPKFTYIEKDLEDINSSFIKEFNSDEILLFLDDHVDITKRLNFIRNNNISNVIYEDNYPVTQGDCNTTKKIIESEDFIVEKEGIRKTCNLSLSEREIFWDQICSYEEAPPLFESKVNRWSEEWTIHPTPAPLLSLKYKNKFKTLYEERLMYTWLCYLKFKQ